MKVKKGAVPLFYFFISMYAPTTDFGESSVRVGDCELDVYVAETTRQTTSGMLGFDDASFMKDGMIFLLGDKPEPRFFHTEGMRMNIRVMGLTRTGEDEYRVNGEAVYSPPGLKSVEIYGDSVLEIPEKLYEKKFKSCLYGGKTE